MSLGRLEREEGQALVEFALVAPILLFLILGIVDFARAWSAYEVITYSARMGARMAVVDDNTGMTQADVVQRIQESLQNGGLDPSRATIGVAGFDAGRGTPLEVQIDYPHSLVWVGIFMDFATGSQDLMLTTEFHMRNE